MDFKVENTIYEVLERRYFGILGYLRESTWEMASNRNETGEVYMDDHAGNSSLYLLNNFISLKIVYTCFFDDREAARYLPFSIIKSLSSSDSRLLILFAMSTASSGSK